ARLDFFAQALVAQGLALLEQQWHKLPGPPQLRIHHRPGQGTLQSHIRCYAEQAKAAGEQQCVPAEQLEFERARIHSSPSSPTEYPAPRIVRINLVGKGSSTLERRCRT